MRRLSLYFLVFVFVCQIIISSNFAELSFAEGIPTSRLVYDDPVDDFAVSEYQPLSIPIADNDGSNLPGWSSLQVVQAVQNGIAANQGNYYQTFSYAPYFPCVGVDYMIYRYETGQNPSTYSASAMVTIAVISPDDAKNAGRSCGVGQPVNVTNGNMWLEQMDYSLPGVGENIEVNRFYNSINQSNGLFGIGWTTKYDESLSIYSDDKMVRLN